MPGMISATFTLFRKRLHRPADGLAGTGPKLVYKVTTP